eukprot:TRINITY_DN25169_c0_g1_i1.p1 TRINITY_DN25169_c0_g1~~TRINITY_DN25169_c0_g1_i1.p1  ORF type:complete len:117 (+),score=16.09 TRINITY_DN25169_c0_g1_i1:57-407(+)
MGTSTSTMSEVDMVNAELKKNVIVVFSTSGCPYCHQLRDLLHSSNLSHLTHTILLDKVPNGGDYGSGLFLKTAKKSVPQVFVGSVFIGGYTEAKHFIESGEMKKMIAAVQAKRSGK